MREGLFYHIMVERPEGWNEELYNKLSFEYLIECAKNGKIVEWNKAYEAYLRSEWERLFPNEGYDLENIWRLVKNKSGFIRHRYSQRNFKNEILRGNDFSEIYLQGSRFRSAHLEEVVFHDAHLEGSYFSNVHLDGADFAYAQLQDATFDEVLLPGAYFSYAHLEGSFFPDAHLEKADFSDAYLPDSAFFRAHLEGAIFQDAHLEGAQFILATVNGDTLFVNNTIDTKTNFTGTSLSSARILPELRTQLERNIREIRWEKWYNDNKILEIPARVFWKISDYGSSTRSILFTFLFSNFVFTMFYLALRDAGLLDGSILSSGNDLLLAYMQTTLVPFGILGITLTDLSLFPVFIIFIQVIFGYTILAALVTRMAIMFQNLSP